jgi:hypothetical protein
VSISMIVPSIGQAMGDCATWWELFWLGWWWARSDRRDLRVLNAQTQQHVEREKTDILIDEKKNLFQYNYSKLIVKPYDNKRK